MKTINLTEEPANWLSYLLNIPSQHLFAFNPDEPILEVLEAINKQLKEGSSYLTKEEFEAFNLMYENEHLYDYLSYTESGKLAKDEYHSLFIKLGLNPYEKSNNLDFGDTDANN